MKKHIPVVPGNPDARRKGLRMVVRGVELDESGAITAISVNYSRWHEWGTMWIPCGATKELGAATFLEEEFNQHGPDGAAP